MKILIAPDKFKGSLSAKELCDAIEEGILKRKPDAQIIKFPLADGGEGSLDIINEHLDLKTVSLEVNDPLFRKITASYKIHDYTAYIEMASASGFDLLSEEERNPMHTTTYGTGEMIQDAINLGVEKIYLFIGGSATCDAGMGMAQALGFEFLDTEGNALKGIGKNLGEIDKILLPADETYTQIEFITLCDVKNPLFGKNGAAHVFAPQKGASIDEVKQLDTGLRNFAIKVNEYLDEKVQLIAGSGAAGGLGAGSIAFLGARLKSGIESIFDIVKFEKQLHKIDLIITGEGKLDKQTLDGKVISGVAEYSRKLGIPFNVICGDVDLDKTDLEELGVNKLASVMGAAKNRKDAFENTYSIVSQISEELWD